jgi:hypothetical protein
LFSHFVPLPNKDLLGLLMGLTIGVRNKHSYRTLVHLYLGTR